ncbi:TPA: hypothetical protein ACH3X1_009554 [Trebouxia sp. C0004]
MGTGSFGDSGSIQPQDPFPHRVTVILMVTCTVRLTGYSQNLNITQATGNVNSCAMSWDPWDSAYTATTMSTECSCHAIVAALEKRDINYAAHVHLGGGCAPVAIEGQGSPVLKATLAAVFYVVGTEHFFKNNSDRLMGKAALRHCVLAKHGPLVAIHEDKRHTRSHFCLH